MSVLLGVVTGKKEFIRDTESFGATVHPTVCTAGMSRVRVHRQVAH